MENKNSPFELTPQLQEYYRKVEITFVDDLNARRFDEAKDNWEGLYDAFLHEQERTGRRFHKGGPLHNLGIISIFQNQTKEAFKYFVLAYTEDYVSKLQTDMGDPPNAPAAQTLISYFGLKENIFNSINQKVQNCLVEGPFLDPKKEFADFWGHELEQQEIKKEIEKASKDPITVQDEPYEIDKMPGSYDIRIFVGGKYDGEDGEYYTRLKQIKFFCREIGFTPLMVSDFTNMNGMSVRKKSLLILHNCKYAIFDVSINAGQLVEIDRCRDYEVENLMVYKYLPNGKTPWTQMILQEGNEPKLFNTEEELKELIKKFLSHKTPQLG